MKPKAPVANVAKPKTITKNDFKASILPKNVKNFGGSTRRQGCVA